MLAVAIAFVLCALAPALYKVLNVGFRQRGLPPGPPTTPILGNLTDIPSKDAHIQFTAWAQKYGEIYSLKLGPGTVVVISSPKTIKQVLEIQSADTADRPASSLYDLVTDGMNFFLCRYNDKWRQMRKAVQSLLSPAASKDYQQLQEAEATQLQYDILTNPEDFFFHIHRFSASITLSILYGWRAPRNDDPTAGRFADLNTRWANFLRPGATPPVDLLPILKYLPEFLAPWRREARVIRAAQQGLYLGLFDECERKADTGDMHAASFVADLIRDREIHGMSKQQMIMLAGSVYEAGAHTTAAFVHNLVKLLVTHPEVQEQAAAELDRVVGDERSPTLEDADDLPYIRALMQETHRFRVITPQLLPHRATCDIQYNGYLIPEGATILGNIHGVFNDPDLFDAPEQYNPARYLKAEFGTRPGVDDSNFRSTLIFGAGRRICPGMHVASASTTLATMKLIWAFKFRPAVDPTTGKFYRTRRSCQLRWPCGWPGALRMRYTLSQPSACRCNRKSVSMRSGAYASRV